MKRILTFCITLCLAVIFAGCAKEPSSDFGKYVINSIKGTTKGKEVKIPVDDVYIKKFSMTEFYCVELTHEGANNLSQKIELSFARNTKSTYDNIIFSSPENPIYYGDTDEKYIQIKYEGSYGNYLWDTPYNYVEYRIIVPKDFEVRMIKEDQN